MWFSIALIVVSAYLLGNLNGAIIASRLIAHEDVRSHGSGNAGLTNFIRNYGIRNALLVILIDVGKAAAACTIGGLLMAPYGYFREGQVLGGLFVLIGHVFPALLGFRGGKGILSGFTIAIMIDWRIALLILAVFVVAYGLTQYVSLGSILGSAGFCLGFVIFHHDNLSITAGGVLMGVLALYMHRGNILRLLRGEERKTNLFSKGRKK